MRNRSQNIKNVNWNLTTDKLCSYGSVGHRAVHYLLQI